MKTSKSKLLICILTSSLILSSSMILSGCDNNRGDDGDNRRLGNNSYYLQPIQLNVSNMETSAFTKVIINDQQNKEILNQNISCAVGADCPISFKERLQTPITLKFYNQNKLITTYTIVDLADNFGKIQTSDVMLGTYIYKQLKARDKSLTTTLSTKLNTFFDSYCSPDSQADNFEELGLYYKAMVVEGKQTEEPFYQKLIADLHANKKLPGGSFSKKKKQSADLQSLIKANGQPRVQAANGGSCSQYTSGIMTAFSGLKLFPIPGLSGPFDFIDRIVKGACDDFEGNVLNSLDEIKEKLNEMDAKLDAIGYQIQELSDKLDHQNLSSNVSQVNNTLEEWSTLRNAYYKMLAGNPTKPYKNFSEFLKDNGNISGIMEKGGAPKVFLTTQLKDFNRLYNQLNETNRLDSIRQSLISLCSTAGNIHEDVLTRRLQCNLIASDMITKLTSTAQEEKLILTDITNAIMQDPEYQEIQKSSSILPPIGTSWEKVDADLSKQQLDKLKVVQSVFASDGIPFLPYQGLSEELQKNVAAVNCNYNNTDTPYITYWKAATDKSKPWDTYISVVCKNGEQEVNSVYNYYQENDNNVRNVLGVLVSDSKLQNAWDRPSDEEFYPIAKIGHYSKEFEAGIFLSGFDGKRLSFNSSYNAFDTRITNSSTYNDLLRWLDDKGMLFAKAWTENDDKDKYYLIPVSYVDNNGVTYVFGMKYKLYSYEENTMLLRLVCLTANCREETPQKYNDQDEADLTKIIFNSELNILLDGGGDNVNGRGYLHIW